MDIRRGLSQPASIEQMAPLVGPKGRRLIGAIAAGAYTDIVGVYGPTEASPGDQVSLDIAIKNTYTYGFYVAATVGIAGVNVSVSPDYYLINTGDTFHFTATFTMPSNDITIDVWSWYWDGAEWVVDDHETVTIKVPTLKPQFSAFGSPGYV